MSCSAGDPGGERQANLLLLSGRHHITILSVSALAASIKEDYELSERCGKHCDEMFKRYYGNGISSDENSSTLSNYVNHYNKKLNKCFILVSTISMPKDKKREFLTIKNLFDINENKEYGSFVKTGEKLMDCRLLDKFCKSEQEWELLIKPYMEE